MEDILVGALTDQEVGHVLAIDLFGFNVKEHVDGRLHVVFVIQRPNLNETFMGFNVIIIINLI